MNPDPALPILRLKPRQQPVVWGGHLLAERLGKPRSDEPIGESWEVWEGDAIENEGFAGQTLKQLASDRPLEVMGRLPVGRGWARFPLLTKFIDASQPLSVQVHPDDAAAQRLESQPNGKTEAWHILAATPDAWIIHGLTRAVDISSFRQALQSGTADDLLNKVRATPGETVFVPAGTVHAIGPGVLLHEVQQTSDVTYRLYDWNRGDRELHLDKGLEVSRLKPSNGPLVEPLVWTVDGVSVALLLACSYFAVKRVNFPGSITLNTAGDSFHILTVLAGECRVESSQGQASLGLGQSALVCASLGTYALQSDVKSDVLVEYIPDLQGFLTRELLGHGFSEVSIRDFLDQFAGSA